MDKFLSEEVWRGIAQRVILFLPQLTSAIMVLLVFWLISAIVTNIVSKLANARDLHHDLLRILVRLLRWSLLAVGLVTALGTVGIDIGALVAGLGLTGFALGIALKDIVSNLLAGVMIIAYKPFQRNDRVNFMSMEGTVTQIDLRFTTLELEDRVILIPNANLLTNAITVIRPQTPLKTPSPRAV